MSMNVVMWELCTFDNDIYRSSNICYSNSIIITHFEYTFISDFRFKISSLPTLALKSQNLIFM
jgi:hypothetical protein